jgi:hypothetical protein
MTARGVLPRIKAAKLAAQLHEYHKIELVFQVIGNQTANVGTDLQEAKLGRAH